MQTTLASCENVLNMMLALGAGSGTQQDPPVYLAGHRRSYGANETVRLERPERQHEHAIVPSLFADTPLFDRAAGRN